MAKTAAERKAEQRERDRMAEEDRLARLLARTIRLDLYRAPNYIARVVRENGFKRGRQTDLEA